MSGLKPSFSRAGTLRLDEFPIESGYDTSIFTGDPIVLNDGYVELSGNDDGEAVFMGCSYIDANGDAKTSAYWPADTVGTEIKAIVFVPTSDSVLEVLADDELDVDAVGEIYELNIVAGNVKSGQSNVTLDAASAGAAAGVRVVGIRKGVNVDSTLNDWDTGTPVRVLVKFTNEFLA